MNNNEEYLILIADLLECQSEEEEKQLLQSKPELLDSGLLQEMEAVSQRMENRGNGNEAIRLRNFARQLINYMPVLVEDRRSFLKQVLETTSDSRGNPQVVYPLLEANLDKLDLVFMEVLRRWSQEKLANEEQNKAASIAGNIVNFSTLIREFPLGKRTINLEIAITGYENALTVFSRDAYPEYWATAQNNLGDAYSSKIYGKRSLNLEKAIKCYQAALEVFTRDAYPENWAMTQNNLGIAYSDRIEGDRNENLKKAIKCYQAALEVFTRDAYPENWAGTQNNLGKAYVYKIKGKRSDNLEEAIKCYQAALEVRTYDTYPEKWAATQNDLAVAYSYRIEGKRSENIEKAIKCYQAALEVRTRDAYLENWAMTQNNLAAAYNDRIEGKHTENIEEAIKCSQAVLKGGTRDAYPEKWAISQNNLGRAYSKIIEGDRSENLKKAIKCYQAALEVFSRDAYPENWAGTQNNLAAAYSSTIYDKRSLNLEESIKCYQAALEVFTRNAYPENWAMTQYNLGMAYSSKIYGKRSQNLEEAIECYKAALKVYRRDAYPENWAMTQCNLGMAYSYRIEGKRSQNIEKAIKYYQAALKVYARNTYPEKWARTQNNLGNAYIYRIKAKRTENLEKAIKCYQAALKVYTRKAYPENWAMTEGNLADTYGDLREIDLKICGLHSALEIYTPTDYPLACLRAGRNLGKAGFENQRWEDAIKGYGDAIKAVEIIRNREKTEQGKQRFIEHFIKRFSDIYNNMIQACINAGKIEQAIEIIERNKSRSLVELLVNRDVYPRGDFFPEILVKLDNLRGQIVSEQQRLSQIFRRELSNTSPDENNPISSRQLSVTTPQQPENTQQILVALQQELQAFIQQEITPKDPEFNLTQKVTPIKFAEITALLDDSTVILEWHLSNESFHVFIITKNHQPRHWHSSLEQLQALNAFKDEYLDAYQTNKQQWLNNLDQRLETLAKTICIDDILAQIPEENREKPKYTQIILVCESFINIFPLHALKIANNSTAENQTTYLIDRFPNGVRYAPSCQLLAVKLKNQKAPTFALQNLFAVANPTEDLEYTEVEVSAIESKFTPTEVLLREKATKEAITKDRLKDKEWLHFSCHGSFSFENWQSAIILAGAVLQGGGGDLKSSEHRFMEWRDGKNVDLEKCIRLWELFNYDLRKCNLVMLSACETGLGDFSTNAKEYISLATAILYAGSGSVVNTLWAVYDFSSAILAIRFYDDLQKNEGKKPVYLVMNEAQKWLRDVETKDFLEWLETVDINPEIKNPMIEKLNRKSDTYQPFSKPQYWAPFCAVG